MLIQTFLFKINRSQITQTNVHLIITDSRRRCLPESRWPVLASEGDDLSFLLTITIHHLTKPAIPCSDSDTELRECQPCCSLHDGYNKKRVGVKTQKCHNMHQGTTLHTDANRLAYPACAFCSLKRVRLVE